jgi:thymidylate synthase
MKQFVDLVLHVLENGRLKEDRTNTGTFSVFGYQNRYNLMEGFPLLGLKKTYTKGVFAELLWFIKGDTNIKYLVDNNVNIWNEWAYKNFLNHAENLPEPDYEFHMEDLQNNCVRPLTQEVFINKIKSKAQEDPWVKKWGELGPVYGKQWIRWVGVRRGVINQLDELINGIKNNPDSRRHIISAWNIDDIPEMALAPCHSLFQFNVVNLSYEERQWALLNGFTPENVPEKKLDCQLYQRSADVFLGVPFNIASYALLTHMIAEQCNLLPGDFIHTFGDAHIYTNHREQVNELLNRTHTNEETWEKFKETGVYEKPTVKNDYFIERWTASKRTGSFYGPDLPKLKLNPGVNSIYDYNLQDIEIIDYKSLPAIQAPVAV